MRKRILKTREVETTYPAPDLALLHEDGRVEIVKRFGYEDFAGRLS
ncbi:MAG: hypothetical protein KA099_12300 [Alphaproteobacteria bacterium]|nr:hypothetical protein [Alphaproteobacteria bacterium]MBP7906094.1 hypothetical protein [Alphaproteobacteria bacterium]